MFNFSKFLLKACDEINSIKDYVELDSLRIKYLGKNSFLNFQFKEMIKLDKQDRIKLGSILNRVKNSLLKIISRRKSKLDYLFCKNDLFLKKKIDISLPGRQIRNGSLHPINIIINLSKIFFSSLGFSFVFGPEIEDYYHNFDALNIPYGHPSRSKKDTFWFNNKYLLRTQTSSVQIRFMKKTSPPIRFISLGRVYRNDCDRLHTPMFHQIEGVIVDKNISISNLKWIIINFLRALFINKKYYIRFRPSYFPFTEPSVEVDIKINNSKWLEILGCGMIHTNVLSNVNIDSNIYSGFAFGIGVERLTMLYYNIKDLRVLFENDIRFLKQFK
ncbi:phenylalanine--tRNA ligase subunit alpha [Candidatus Purcelliella pentastirinorum]|uniref:phenylalanine--tRNA ligase subunit alpha n=1 Tax=Candidatus Purcelliella pentastirinorum TaxID=472834 RepID=UPI00236759B8|nr:phenylalanine--tRNA ligase subunit alpha [Candidatus Purcelliella pentastirinorum]WDI78884.1 phenylalanine--tRNA ligase subunit alpha [Candidatus Purcelliella pentastirinorum]WDR80018.1 phenylalanine--tRNA ligase subunit alpha [Candidatus Purcelliella pentastirinorum]